MVDSVHATDLAAILETSLLKCQKRHCELRSAKPFLAGEQQEPKTSPFLVLT